MRNLAPRNQDIATWAIGKLALQYHKFPKVPKFTLPFILSILPPARAFPSSRQIGSRLFVCFRKKDMTSVLISDDEIMLTAGSLDAPVTSTAGCRTDVRAVSLALTD